MLNSKKALSLALCAGIVMSSFMGVSVSAKTDPFLNDKTETTYQYQFDSIHVREAWKLLEEKGYTKTKVGVMDTGIDPEHEDLKGNLAEYVTVRKGKVEKGRQDLENHGTHVSGIIAATYGNGKGGSGVATGTKNDMVELYVASVSDEGAINDVDMERALEYFAEKGVKVVNMSLGGYQHDDDLGKAMKKAYDLGITLVAASGNDDTDNESAPSVFKEVISVNATDKENKTTFFSNYGYSTDISAPGFNVLSTIPGNKYQMYSGTSMACPVVTGVVSLMYSANKDLTPRQVYNILCATADRGRNGGKTFDVKQYAYGEVDALAAVKAAYEMKEKPTSEVSDLFIKQKTLTVKKGYPRALETLITPASSTAETKWRSSDSTVAEVNDDGYVIGKKVGSAVITATAGGKSVSADVNVEEAVLPADIEIIDKKTVLSVGEGDLQTVKVTPSDADIKEWYAKSSDPSVAVAYDNGGVYAKKVGTADITVRTINGIEKTYTVTVKPAAGKIKITKYTKKIKAGKSFIFNAEVLNTEGEKELAKDGLKWSVTDTSIASIDKKTGKFTAKKAGKVYVKAASNALMNDGINHASAVIKVTVTPGKDSSDDKIIPYKEKGSKVKAMHLTDELDTNKSKALDMMYAYYGEIAANKTKYSKALLKTADELMAEAVEIIKSADDKTKLFKEEFSAATGKFETLPDGKLADYASYFSTMFSYDNLKLTSEKDLLKLKKDSENNVKQAIEGIDKNNFNSYYLQLVKAPYKKIASKVRKSESIAELIKAESELGAIKPVQDKNIKFVKDVRDYDEIYTKNDIDTIKKLIKRQLSSYVNGQLAMSSYKDNMKELKADLAKYKKAIDKAVYMGDIFEKKEAYIEAFEKKTGIMYEKATNAENIRMITKLNKLIAEYARKNYTDKNWMKIQEIMGKAYETAESADYSGEIYMLDKKTEKKLKAVKTGGKDEPVKDDVIPYKK